MKKIIQLGLFKYDKKYIDKIVKKYIFIHNLANYNDALNSILKKIIYKFTLKIDYKCKFYNFDFTSYSGTTFYFNFIFTNSNFVQEDKLKFISHKTLINLTSKNINSIEKEYYKYALLFFNGRSENGRYLMSRGPDKPPKWVSPDDHLKYKFNFQGEEIYIQLDLDGSSSFMYTFRKIDLDVCQNILFRNYLYELYIDYIVNNTNYINLHHKELYYDNYVTNKVTKNNLIINKPSYNCRKSEGEIINLTDKNILLNFPIPSFLYFCLTNKKLFMDNNDKMKLIKVIYVYKNYLNVNPFNLSIFLLLRFEYCINKILGTYIN